MVLKDKHYQILERIALVGNVFCWNDKAWDCFDPKSNVPDIAEPVRLDGRMCRKLLSEGYLALHWKKQRSAIYHLTDKGKMVLETRRNGTS